MKFFILASGSRGNSLFVESHHGRFLIDVGLSARQIELRLHSKEIDPASIDAIILTHAHRDHVAGVGVFANRHKLPIYGHPETLDNISYLLKPHPKIKPWTGEFAIKDVRFTPFRVSHDCHPTHGYLVQENNSVLGVCTDLGVVTNEVKQHIRQAHALLLESNHDPNLLMNGPYPWHLKERVSGRLGHLSNHNAGELLKEIFSPHLGRVVLGHLSQENNTAALAYQTVLEYVGADKESIIDVVEQKNVSEMYYL